MDEDETGFAALCASSLTVYLAVTALVWDPSVTHPAAQAVDTLVEIAAGAFLVLSVLLWLRAGLLRRRRQDVERVARWESSQRRRDHQP